MSTRSNSPKEAPTPRSHKGAIRILGQSQHSKRGSLYFESDAGDSDSSVRSSSLMGGPRRTESPGSDVDLHRSTSTGGRNRRSMILPGSALTGSNSPRRESPSRTNQPSSPLRLTKPHLPCTQESGPITNYIPTLVHGRFQLSSHATASPSASIFSDIIRRHASTCIPKAHLSQCASSSRRTPFNQRL